MTDSYPLDTPGPIPAEEIAAAWQRESPDVPTGSITVVTPLWRLAKVLADDRRRLLRMLDIDPAMLDLISTLRRSGTPYTLTTRQLADQCLVSAGAISQRVLRGETLGLVARGAAGGRPKSVSVTLTERGRDLGEQVTRELLTRESYLISGLDEDQRTSMADALKELLASVRLKLDQ